MKEYDKNKEPSYLKYWDVNNLYGSAMLMERRYFSLKIFMKNFNNEIDEKYFLEVDVQHPEKLHELHKDFPFLSEKMKTKKVEKLVTSLHDKTEHVINIKNLEQAWKSIPRVCRVIRFNQKAWLKSYIDLKIKLRQKSKRNFEKDFFMFMNNAVFGKTKLWKL